MALTDTFVRQVKHNGTSAGNKHMDGQVNRPGFRGGQLV